MPSLNQEHIDFMQKDLNYRGIVYEPLEDEVLDHICILVEEKMEKGMRFIDAYHVALASFGDTREMQSLQHRTIEFTHHNTRIMIKNYFKITLRNLSRHSFYTFVNVAGLAVGIACCLLIGLYIKNELSYDTHHQMADRIYRINTEIKYADNHMHLATGPAPLAEAVAHDYPEIVAATRLRSYGAYLVKRDKENFTENNVILADPSVFEVFTIPLLAGDAKTALKEPNTLVISEGLVQKYFPDTDPVNQSLVLDNDHTYKVTGVFEDMPENAHFHFDMMLSMTGVEESQSPQWLSNNFHTYVLLNEGVQEQVLESKFHKMAEKYIGPQIKQLTGYGMDEFHAEGNKIVYTLQSIQDIHLRSNLLAELEPNSDMLYVYLFSISALFILVIACINFMNLSTARSASRAKEVGVRKVLGSYRTHLIKQFLTESTLLSMLSFITGLVLAYVALPYFNLLSGKALQLPFNDIWFVALMFGTAILIGIFAGIYPAFFLSAFKPVTVLKGKFSRGTKSSVIRRSLVVFQFAVSMILIIGSATVYQQLKFIQNKKLGFQKDRIVILHDAYALGKDLNAFKTEVVKDARIEKGTVSSFLPVSNSSRSDQVYWPYGEGVDSEYAVDMQSWGVDDDYISTMNMKIIEGRNFSRDFPSDSSAVILNQKAVEMYGFRQPIGEKITTYFFSAGENLDPDQTESYEVIGVIENFHFESLKENIRPLGMFLSSSNGMVSFKFNSENVEEVIALLENQWKQTAPDQPFNYSFLDEEFNDMYRAEQKMGMVFSLFSGLAIFIACLGLFALATFTAEQKTKEIGIRKVMGASVKNIVILLSGEFSKLIFLAFIIAAPSAWWLTQFWLKDYSFKVLIGPETYLLAGSLAFAVAFLTIGYQALKAATGNPVKALRAE